VKIRIDGGQRYRKLHGGILNFIRKKKNKKKKYTSFRDVTGIVFLRALLPF